MELKKEFIGQIVTIKEPINISFEVSEKNVNLLKKFNLLQFFVDDSKKINNTTADSGNGKRKSRR